MGNLTVSMAFSSNVVICVGSDECGFVVDDDVMKVILIIITKLTTCIILTRDQIIP